jgi:inner membrane protein
MGMATLMIASNLPDIDVAVFATDTLAMSFRRGWTHGVLAMAILPAILAGLMFVVGTRRSPRRGPSGGPSSEGPPLVRFRSLLLLAYIGTIAHVFMDWLNSYGVRLLMPFSNRWFYGDALYIVDPFLYLILGGAVFLARRAARRGDVRPWQPARLGLAVAAGYIVLMLASNWWARAEVRGELQRAGRPDTRFMVTPVVANPFRREVIVETAERYEKGTVWFEPAPHFRPGGFGVNTNESDPAAREAAQTTRFQAFLRWSRFPYFVIERTGAGTRVFLNDYRYSSTGRDGWSAVSTNMPGK